MFNKFKNIARLMSFILILNILVFDFGIKPKEVKASTINALISIDYDFKFVDNKIAFDFTKSLGEGDAIQSVVLKKSGGANLNIEAHDNAKKIWKTDALFEKAQYELNITLNTNNSTQKLISTFYYEDYEMDFEPIVVEDGNNLKITNLTNWANKFLGDDTVEIDIIGTNGSVAIPAITKKFSECKSDIVLTGVKDNLTNLRAYVVRAKVKQTGTEFNRVFIKEFTADPGKKARQMNSKLVSMTRRENGNFDLNVSVYYTVATGPALYIYYAGSSLGSTTKRASGNNKLFEFQDVAITLGTRCNLKEGNGVREDYIGFYEKTKLDASKINCDSLTLASEEARGVKIKLNKSMRDVFSTTGANNKVIVYELNDNFGKTKIGELSKIQSLSTNTINFSNNKALEKGKAYFIEFNNGAKSFGQSFIYYPMNTSVSEIKETSARIGWSYPSGYSPASGDRVEIFLRDVQNSSTFSAIPKLTLAHGTNNVNFANTSSTVVTGMAPGTSYEAKVILYNQRGTTNSFVEFTTLPFGLTSFIQVENCQYRDAYYKEAWPRNRRINVTWDFEPSNMQFYEGDKVEIFVKPNGNGAFSGYPTTGIYNNPLFTATQNLNSVKSATITVPSWEANYHIDLIYTIGGKQIITSKDQGEEGESAYNRRTVCSRLSGVTLLISDQTQTSAKVTWEIDPENRDGEYEEYQPENGHKVRLDIKKTNGSGGDNNFTGDPEFEYVYGTNWDYKKGPQEYMLNNLEPDQWYRVRIQHIVQSPGDFGLQNLKGSTNYYNFRTSAFNISTLTAENQEDDISKVKLKWETVGEVTFGEGDNLEVFLKESTSSEYPETPVSGLNLTPGTSTEAIIEVPKFNTLYNAKVEYTLKGKKISQFVLVQADAELGIEVSDITNSSGWSAKVKWTYPNGYKESNRPNDKVKLTVAKRNDSARNLPTDKEIEVTKKEESLSGLEENATYDVTLKFLNGEGNNKTDVYTVTTSFKATSDLQIIGLNATNVKTKTGTISWSFAPNEKQFQSNDKVEIFIKEKSNSRSNDNLSDFTKIYTMTQGSSSRSGEGDIAVINNEPEHSEHVSKTGPLKDFKSLNLIDLGVNKEYVLKVRYTMTESSETKTSESEVNLKTKVDTLKATVFVSDQTSATFGWEYPPEYELQAGDKIDIYIKEVEEDSTTRDGEVTKDYGDPMLTLTHGTSGDNVYDMNEVTRVDVAGLTPERKYKSKIKFTMGTGDTAYSIETEVDISTKAFEIKTFQMDSYYEYDILVSWDIEPQGINFGYADTLEIFVARQEDEYSTTPAYKLTKTPMGEEEKTIDNTFSDYVLAESLGVPQKMKLVYTVGDRKYEKELEFTNTINPIKASVFSVDQTKAMVQIELPDNYEFVEGDALLIYAKDEFAGDGELISDDYLVYEGVQTSTANISDMTLIELSYLLPEAGYEVAVALDLEDGQVEPARLEFVTTGVQLSDVSLQSIKYDSSIVSWNYGDKELDFFGDESDYDFSDKLIIATKESDGSPINPDIDTVKALNNQEYIGEEIKNVKDASIKIEDTSKDYEGIVFYDIGGLVYSKNFKISHLTASIDENSIESDKATFNWKYPSNLKLEDSDKTEVFVRKTSDSEYPSEPAFSGTGSGTQTCALEGLSGGTEYTVKVQITKEGITIDPIEAQFTTQSAVEPEIVIENLDYEVTGTLAEFSIPNAEQLDIDKGGTIGLRMGDEPYQGFVIEFNDAGTGFSIKPTIPNKKYENIEVEIPLADGSTFKMTIKEFTTQPENLTQDWLSNSYKFALERFPDEEGYEYWYNRMLNKQLNGEYFLKNLMFAEDEFTNRNLQDRELIAALYQIVVNREYDEEGLNFWVEIYKENLQNAGGQKKLAQEVLVDRMVHEPEFGKLCTNAGIFWTQAEQDAAGVPS